MVCHIFLSKDIFFVIGIMKHRRHGLCNILYMTSAHTDTKSVFLTNVIQIMLFIELYRCCIFIISYHDNRTRIHNIFWIHNWFLLCIFTLLCKTVLMHVTNIMVMSCFRVYNKFNN